MSEYLHNSSLDHKNQTQANGCCSTGGAIYVGGDLCFRLSICKCDYKQKDVRVQLDSSAIAICSVRHKEQFNLKVNLG